MAAPSVTSPPPSARPYQRVEGGQPREVAPQEGTRVGAALGGRRLAQLALVLLSIGGAAALAVQVATWPDHPLADMTHLKWWAQMTHERGVEVAYSGTYPETYVIYPPGMVY